jgi:phage terminase small subunit
MVADYDLQAHHLRLLTLAGEAWDRAAEARERIAADGAYAEDRFGQLRAHPAIAVERDARLAFARLIRELALDDEEPPGPRPPRVSGRYV